MEEIQGTTAPAFAAASWTFPKGGAFQKAVLGSAFVDLLGPGPL